MRRVAISLATAFVLATSAVPAGAAGCLKGAAVGAVAGHVAHHHAVLGAIAGCAIGHHLAHKAKEQKAALQAAKNPPPKQP
jgi:outer membrane lipoprotein SlyB